MKYIKINNKRLKKLKRIWNIIKTQQKCIYSAIKYLLLKIVNKYTSVCGACVAEESGVRDKTCVAVRYLAPYFGYIVFYPKLTGRRNALPKKAPKELYKRNRNRY